MTLGQSIVDCPTGLYETLLADILCVLITPNFGSLVWMCQHPPYWKSGWGPTQFIHMCDICMIEISFIYMWELPLDWKLEWSLIICACKLSMNEISDEGQVSSHIHVKPLWLKAGVRPRSFTHMCETPMIESWDEGQVCSYTQVTPVWLKVWMRVVCSYVCVNPMIESRDEDQDHSCVCCVRL